MGIRVQFCDLSIHSENMQSTPRKRLPPWTQLWYLEHTNHLPTILELQNLSLHFVRGGPEADEEVRMFLARGNIESRDTLRRTENCVRLT